MNKLDELDAQIAKLQEERNSVKLKERDNVLAQIKKQIKDFGFKTSDFKGVLATRKKRRTGVAAKKVATAKKINK